MQTNSSLLTVEHLGMHFGGIQALKDVTFTVQKDSITALIGPNGAGKTTLFNCLTGFYQATMGSLIFYPENTPINLIQQLGGSFKIKYITSPKDFFSCLYYKMFGGSHLVARSGIARTFQNIRLFKEMTVVENLLVAQHQFAYRNLIGGLLKTKVFQEWEENSLNTAFYWLSEFGLLPLANRLAGELSYGQQRYLEIARCLCIKPKLLCLDEPAAGLNPIETEKLSVLIQKIKNDHQLSILLIEHDMNMVMNISDHIVVLDHGKVICQGTPQTVREDKKVLAAYLGIDDAA